MPKIVDHGQRREQIAKATLLVIRKIGVEKATVRAISRAGGFSSGVLAHYFHNKDELVGFAFQWTAELAFEALEACSKKYPPGLPRVRASLERMLPEPNARMEHTHLAISTSFWGHALHNPDLARQFQINYGKWRGFVRRYLKEAIAEGQVPKSIVIDDEVDLLVSAIDGLWISEALEPKRFTARRRKRLLNLMIEAIVRR